MKEEKKDKKKKSIVLIIAAVAILLVAIAGATYAYFTASGGSTQNSLFNTTTESVDAVSCTSADVSLIVKAEDMAVSAGTAGGTAINPSNSTSNEDANGTITCTAQKNSSSPTICTYDLVYTPAQGKAFTTYSAENDYSNPELTLQGSSSTTTGTIASGKTSYAETDMYTMQSQTTLISSGSWTFSAAGSMTYTFTPTFYNYNFEQKDLANSSWGGTISVVNLSCSPVNETPEQAPADIYTIVSQSQDLNSYSRALYEGKSIAYAETQRWYTLPQHPTAAAAMADWGQNSDPVYLRLKMKNTPYWTLYSTEAGYQGEYPGTSCEPDSGWNDCYDSEIACNAAKNNFIEDESRPSSMEYGSVEDFVCQRRQEIDEAYIEFVVTNEMVQSNPGMVAGTYSLRAKQIYDPENGECLSPYYDSQNDTCSNPDFYNIITQLQTIFDYEHNSGRCTSNEDLINSGHFTCSIDDLIVNIEPNSWDNYYDADTKITVESASHQNYRKACSMKNGEAWCGQTFSP